MLSSQQVHFVLDVFICDFHPLAVIVLNWARYFFFLQFLNTQNRLCIAENNVLMQMREK